MAVRRSLFILMVFVLGFQGYPIVAALTQLLGVNNTPVSFALRGVVVGLSIVLLLMPWRHPRGTPGLVFGSLLVFWLAYFWRLLYAMAFDPAQLANGVAYYWIWGLGTCFLPMISLVLSRSWARIDETGLFRALALANATAAILVLFNVASSGLEPLLWNGRFQLDALNPITMGHTAAIFALIGVYSIRRRRDRKRNLFWIVLPPLMIGLGLIGIFISGSRGAQVSFAVAVIFFLLGQPIKTVFKVVVLGMFLWLVLFSVLADLSGSFNILTGDRIANALAGTDYGVSGRIFSYSAAWNIFLDHPILGRSITEPFSGTYPHNIILESLMATGVVGGIPLVIALLGGVVLGWRLQRQKSPASWLALLYIETLVGAMFSGAIYNVGGLWITLGCLVGISRKAVPPNSSYG